MKGVYERNCPLVDFPGSLEVKTPCSQCMGRGSAPGWESKIHMPCGLKKKKKSVVPTGIIQLSCLSFAFTESMFSHFLKLLPLCILNSCLWLSLVLDLFFCSTDLSALPAPVYSFNHCGFMQFRIW